MTLHSHISERDAKEPNPDPNSNKDKRDGPILLLGSAGQVGTELLKVFTNDKALVAPRRSELDLTDAKAMRRFLRDLKPQWILNAAAYTAVDRAETEPELAYAINAEAVRTLGEEAAAMGAVVLHFSTDYVFDGAAATPRQEHDPTNPLGVYGSSKLAGEQALIGSGAAHFIFRTSWVYGTHGKNFLLTILKLAHEREELRIVADQKGAPTFARDLALLTRHAMRRSASIAAAERTSLGEAVSSLGGLYHACNTGETSWFGFAEEFMQLAQGKDASRPLARLTPITTAEYPTPAQRPADSRLDCTLLKQRLGFEMPTWRQSLAEAITALYAGQRQSPSEHSR